MTFNLVDPGLQLHWSETVGWSPAQVGIMYAYMSAMYGLGNKTSVHVFSSEERTKAERSSELGWQKKK